MKGFLKDVAGQTLAALVPFALIGIAAYIVYRKLNVSVTPSLDKAVDAAVPTVSQLLYDANESTYITDAQAKALARKKLAEKQALAGGADVIAEY